MPFDFDKGIARVPPLIGILSLVGTGVAGRMGGFLYAGSFLVGATAAYVNFRLIERFVDRLGQLALAGSSNLPKVRGVRLFIQFILFVLGAFVILRLSGFNVIAALCGFLVCPAAVILEILYELLTYGHS
jgi:hypothetical protein